MSATKGHKLLRSKASLELAGNFCITKVVVIRVKNVLLYTTMNALKLLFRQRAKAKEKELVVPVAKAGANVVLQDLNIHLVVPVPKVRAKARRVQTLKPESRNVHLDLLVVNVEQAKLVCVVPLTAINTFLLSLGNKVVVALLRMRKIALLVRLFWMENVRKAQSAENGMLLIANTSNLGAVLLGAIVFLFTEAKMAMSSIWAGPMLLGLSGSQKLKLRAKQAHVFHWSHKILVKSLCRWNRWASRRYKSNRTVVSVSDVLHS